MSNDNPNLIYAQQELASARQHGHRFAEILAFDRLGTIYSDMAEASGKQDQKDESQKHWLAAIEYFQQGMSVAKELGDKTYEAGLQIKIELAQWQLKGGELSAYYIDALAVARQMGDRIRERRMLAILGTTYAIAQDFQTALDYELQALGVAREIGDKKLLSETLGSTANTYAEAADYAHAIPFYEEAIAITRSNEIRESLDDLLGMLAQACNDSGDRLKAIQCYEEAIAIKRAMEGRKPLLEYYLNNLAYLYLSGGDKDHAINCFEEVLANYRSQGDRNAEIQQLFLMALALNNSTNDQKLSMHYAEQHLALAREKGDYQTVASALKAVAEIYFKAGNSNRAFDMLKEAVTIVHDNENNMLEYQILLRLSGMHKQLGNLQEAANYSKQAHLLPSKRNDPYSQVSLAKISEDEGDLTAAIDSNQQALDIFMAQNHQDWIKMTQERIAELRRKLDEEG